MNSTRRQRRVEDDQADLDAGDVIECAAHLLEVGQVAAQCARLDAVFGLKLGRQRLQFGLSQVQQHQV